MSQVILKVDNVHSQVSEKQILKGVNLEVKLGEVHVIMGPNGAGKSTLANVLMGHPAHIVTEGSAEFNGKSLFDLAVDERAREGMFMSFQYPEEVPGVTVTNFLRTAKGQIDGEMPSLFEINSEINENLEDLAMSPAYLERYLNHGFSGGEKKKNEILQMSVLQPKLAILDETDSGLDVDAIKNVYEKIQKLSTQDNAILVITHYNKILQYIKPDYIHVLVDGKIVRSGDLSLAEQIESQGYEAFKEVV